MSMRRKHSNSGRLYTSSAGTEVTVADMMRLVVCMVGGDQISSS